MNATDSERVDPMLNPPHLGELIRESMDEVGWSVTETAAHLGCERGTLSRLLNGKSGVSANMALALEAVGWGTADHWMRMQASYELAQARGGRRWRRAGSGPRIEAATKVPRTRYLGTWSVIMVTKYGPMWRVIKFGSPPASARSWRSAMYRKAGRAHGARGRVAPLPLSPEASQAAPGGEWGDSSAGSQAARGAEDLAQVLRRVCGRG